MTRIKLLAISAITTAMIAGSAVAVAVAPVDDSTTGSADATIEATDAAGVELIKPARRGGGGSGKALRK